MPRKLFISFLGTSFYQECTYFDAKGEYAKTRYIQCATLEQVGAKDWTPADAIRIFVTDKARTSNWDKNIAQRTIFKGKPQPYTGLEADLCRMHLSASIEAVSVSDGKDEKEIWSIFEAMYNEMGDGDELYIDLTHAFRYLPMLMLVLSNYAKFLKNAKVCHLSYGNWEASVDGRAPIVDLMPLTMLQDWVTATSEFLRYGYSDNLQQAIYSKLLPMLKEKDRESIDVNILGTKIQNYSENRTTCRGMNIAEGKDVRNLIQQLNKIERTDIAPFNPIVGKLKATMTELPDVPTRCADAAQWCYDHQLYQQAITLLLEGVNTFFSMRNGIRIDDDKRRDYVGQAFNKRNDDLDRLRKGQKLRPDIRYEDNVHFKALLSDELLLREDVVTNYVILSGTRNDFNHSGFRSTRLPMKSSDIKKTIKDGLLFFRPILSGSPSTDDTPQPAVLLNISNHPSAKWGEAQKAAAEQLGTVCDMPFPQIEPTTSESDIASMADGVLQQIRKQYAGTRLTVHVMGEMTFTFALVTRLKARGIRCVASCTARIARDLGDGRKESQFRFVGFRDY